MGIGESPADVPNAEAPDAPSFEVELSFSNELAPGPHELYVQAFDGEGISGPRQTLGIEATPREVPQGELVFSLDWNTQSDLDLHVTTPRGEIIWAKDINSFDPPAPGDPPVAEDAFEQGGILDFDSNAACTIDGRQQENIAFAQTPEAGEYVVRVNTASLCGQPGAFWNLRVLVQDEVQARAQGSSVSSSTRFGSSAGSGKPCPEVLLQPGRKRMRSWFIAALSSFGFHSVVAASVLTGGNSAALHSISAPVEFTLTLPDEQEEPPVAIQDEARAEEKVDPIPTPVKSTPKPESANPRAMEQAASQAQAQTTQGPVVTGITMSNGPQVGSQAQTLKGAQKKQLIAKAVQTSKGPCEEAMQKPKPLLRTTPIPYPSHIQSQGIEGRLVIRAYIDEKGNVDKLDVLSSVHPTLDRLAEQAVRTWTFRPAMRCGKAVAGGTYTMARRFVLENN